MPTELILHIADAIDSEKDLNNFARACRRLYKSLNESLYKRHAKDCATSALLWASERGLCETARRFIGLGADVNATANDGLTPLMLSALKGHDSMTSLLLSVDSTDVNAQHRLMKKTALHWAVMQGHLGVVKLLVAAKGIKLNEIGGNYGGTPLITLIAAATPNKAEIVKLLVKQPGIDLNRADEKWHLSPLVWAIQDRQTAVASIFMKQEKVDVNFTDPQGRTPLWWASRMNDETSVRLLLGRDDVDIDAADDKGRTPLWTAAKRGHASIVQMLLSKGADPTTRDKKALTKRTVSSRHS